MDYDYTVTEKFLRYVQVDTQSDPLSATHPSTEKQKELSKILAAELLAMGLQDAYADEYGYVYATIAATTNKTVPVICFCSHIDTSSDCSGTGVKPILHKHFTGEDMVLPDDNSLVIGVKDFPYLQEHFGHDIITASGQTLLGADDKAGVSIIMDMANYLTLHPEVKHGVIKIVFTPDEEIGKGTAKMDLEKPGADFGYTLDGGEAGCFEEETFSADGATITIHGVSAHPGLAKGKMVNALKIAGEILAALPTNEWCPEATEGREGFVHPVRMEGIAERASIDFIVRDFITANLAVYEERLKQLADGVIKKHPGALMDFTVYEQYRNMFEIVKQYPALTANAEEAYKRCGLPIIKEAIRGGTDGSKLSFMGLPCPNIFTGMQAIHSRREWVGVKDLQKAVDVLVQLVQVWEERA